MIEVKLNGLKVNFEIIVSIQCFRGRPLWDLHSPIACIVTSHVLTVTDENREYWIFPILPVLTNTTKRLFVQSQDKIVKCIYRIYTKRCEAEYENWYVLLCVEDQLFSKLILIRQKSQLRTPELVGLAYQFCAS